MKYKFTLLVLLVCMLATSCRPTKHVPQGEYLLNRVKIEVDNKEVKSQSLHPYLRQQPNHKTFGIIGLPLAFYNMSGTKDNRWNRFMRKIGTPPVIYDSTLTEKSRKEILKAMNNKGYIDAEIIKKLIKERKLFPCFFGSEWFFKSAFHTSTFFLKNRNTSSYTTTAFCHIITNPAWEIFL